MSALIGLSNVSAMDRLSSPRRRFRGIPADEEQLLCMSVCVGGGGAPDADHGGGTERPQVIHFDLSFISFSS